MSAKVIKCKEPVELARLPIPEIGETDGSIQTNGAFVVPAFDPTIFQAQPHADEPLPLTATPEEVLENARHEAARIVAEAEESKLLLEQAAFEKAQIEAGAAIEVEVEARIADVREQLAGSLEKLSNLSNEIAGHIESDVVELAMQIAKKIVRREVTIDREVAITLVRVSLSKLNQRTAAEVHLNPDDLAYINTRLDALDFRGALTLVEDPSISLGGCLVHTETGEVDARIESQFDEIAFGLLS
jgi:flagellar assembly protein FliH